MKKKPLYLKIAGDVLRFQLKWTIPFFSIILLVHFIQNAPAITKGQVFQDFLLTSYISCNIYMFVVGIVSAAVFLPLYVKNGVTRKDTYKGMILGSAGLALALVLASAFVAGVEHLVVQLTAFPYGIESINLLHEAKETTNNIIAIIVTGMLFSPMVDPGHGWLLTLFIFTVNLYTYFVMGWMIGAGFYRMKLIGFSVLALFIAILRVRDLVWESGLPLYASVAGLLVLIGIMLGIIKLLSRRVTVKL